MDSNLSVDRVLPVPAVFLSLTEGSALLGIPRATLSKYRLPDPDAVIGGVRGWRADTLESWNAARPGRGNWGRPPA